MCKFITIVVTRFY